MTTWAGTPEWNPSNTPPLSVGWDHLHLGTHAIPLLFPSGYVGVRVEAEEGVAFI